MEKRTQEKNGRPQLAEWAKNDLATLRETWHEFVTSIDWQTLVIGTLAAVLTASFMALPWLADNK